MRTNLEPVGPRRAEWARRATHVESLELSVELGDAGQRIAVRLGFGAAEFDAAVAEDVAKRFTGCCRRHGSGGPPLSREGPRSGRPRRGREHPVASLPAAA